MSNETKKTEQVQLVKNITINAPKIETVCIKIIGTAQLVVNKFSAKAKQQMMEKQQAGSQAKKGVKREAKDFDRCFQEARHISTEGWDGFPASAFRNAMIDACRLVNFKMTLAKLSVWIVGEGTDKDEGVPLVRIQGKEPVQLILPTRNETGVIDIRCRPCFRNWSMELKVQFDADVFSATDVTNLLMRVGMQVGIGEGRPYSKNSAGMGWGTFKLEGN